MIAHEHLFRNIARMDQCSEFNGSYFEKDVRFLFFTVN